jgi:hypothetical protein
LCKISWVWCLLQSIHTRLTSEFQHVQIYRNFQEISQKFTCCCMSCIRSMFSFFFFSKIAVANILRVYVYAYFFLIIFALWLNVMAAFKSLSQSLWYLRMYKHMHIRKIPLCVALSFTLDILLVLLGSPF